VDARLKAKVRRRAGFCCEYCRFPERFAELRFQVDHIVPQQHGGPTVSANLAWSCLPCNKHKGPNLSGIDPVTGQVVRLFHPRRDRWAEHFAWGQAKLIGLTPLGRATISVLKINRSDAILVREALMEEGLHLTKPKRAGV